MSAEAYSASDNLAKCFAPAIEKRPEELASFTRVDIRGCTLYRANCLEVLPLLQRVHHVFTDPPYEAHMHNNKASAASIRLDGYASPKPLDFGSIDSIRETVTPLLANACTGWLLAFCTPEGVAPWRDAIEAAGARYKRACVWDKPDAAPQLNGQGPAFAAEMFVAAWCGEGVSKWNGGGRRNVFRHLTNGPDREGTHPTEKPTSLMREIVGLFSNAGEIVLDPFMGSGTTGVACAKLGRKFIGIEIDRRYFDLLRADASRRPTRSQTYSSPMQILRLFSLT